MYFMPLLRVKYNNLEIISVFCFTRIHVWNWNIIISAAIYRALKLFKIISATLNMLENIHELRNKPLK